MKKFFKSILFVAFATLTFTSCNKENTLAIQENTVIDFTMDYANFSGDDTKAKSKSAWEDGDGIYLMFKGNGATEFDVQNHVKVVYNSATNKWSVAEGQETLNSLANGAGKVMACHSARKDISPTYHSYYGGSYCVRSFLLTCSNANFEKESNKITATLQFKIWEGNEFQFNILGLNYENGTKHILNISKIKSGYLDAIVSGKNYIPVFKPSGIIEVFDNGGKEFFANPPCGENTGISFFAGFNHDASAYETGEFSGTAPNFSYNFNARFELKIKIDETNFVIYKDFKPLNISSYKVYNIASPTATETDIKNAAPNEDLGNGWFKK